MSNYQLSILTGVVILVVAIPYVMRIRHPKQKPLAAYFIFVSVFAASAFVLFNLLARFAIALGLGMTLGEAIPALLLLILIFVPAVILATWLARKPPWRQGPPP